MPEVDIEIGGRNFQAACQVGEEPYLQSAAKMLDQEAVQLIGQIGRVPEERMLLMSGLMLADKIAALEDKLNAAEKTLQELNSELAKLRNTPPPEPVRVEVPTVPVAISEGLAELAARAESIADKLDK